MRKILTLLILIFLYCSNVFCLTEKAFALRPPVVTSEISRGKEEPSLLKNDELFKKLEEKAKIRIGTFIIADVQNKLANIIGYLSQIRSLEIKDTDKKVLDKGDNIIQIWRNWSQHNESLMKKENITNSDLSMFFNYGDKEEFKDAALSYINKTLILLNEEGKKLFSEIALNLVKKIDEFLMFDGILLDTKGLIGQTMSYIKEVESLVHENDKGSFNDSALAINESMDDLLELNGVLADLDSTNINDIILIYLKNKIANATYEKRLEFAPLDIREELKFKRDVKDEPKIILCIINCLVNRFFRDDTNSYVIIKTSRKRDETIVLEVIGNVVGIPVEDKESQKALGRIFEEEIINEGRRNHITFYDILEYLKVKGGNIQVDTMWQDSIPRRLVFEDSRLTKMRILEGDKIPDDGRKREEQGTTFTIWFPAAKGVDVTISDAGLRMGI